jgi:hypothetical protein
VVLLIAGQGGATLTAAEKVGEASTGTDVFLLLFALAWALWPLAILTNFKGYRDRSARRALRTARQIRRLPPYRWWERDPQSDRRFATFFQFVVAIGLLLSAIGLAAVALVGLLRD